jgi:hypothetical protein
MPFITELEGAFAWIGTGGVYRQTPLYYRGEALFAKWGAGYVRLRAHGATSAPKVIWHDLDGGDLFHIENEQGKDPRSTKLFPGSAKIAAE